LRELTKKVKKFDVAEYKNPQMHEVTGEAGDKITQDALMPRYERFFKPNDIIIADCGTSSTGMSGLKLPDGAVWHNGILWSTIGFATPASLGACLADPSRRTVIVTGDGAHQLTANEIGNFYRHGAKPIMFVVNNGGFSIERVLEEYPDYVYNDIAAWEYHKLPEALGCKDWYTAKVTNLGELDAAMAMASVADTGCYIEIVLDKHDYPAAAKAMPTRWEEFYGIAQQPGQPE